MIAIGVFWSSFPLSLSKDISPMVFKLYNRSATIVEQ